MGTDIHGVFQRFDPTRNAWRDVESSYEQWRNYQLFAVLAGIRNGFGFAGVVTGQPVVPISMPRSLPADFLVDADYQHPVNELAHIAAPLRQWRRAGEELTVWLGDHSHSWLEANEMLEWQPPIVCKTGILSRAIYETWDKQSHPAEYGGGVSGPNVIIVDDNEIAMAKQPGWTHVRCEWDSDLKKELAYFFDEVRRLQQKHGRVRFVFGFDS